MWGLIIYIVMIIQKLLEREIDVIERNEKWKKENKVINRVWNFKIFKYKILLLKILGNVNICQFSVIRFDSDRDPLFVSNFLLELFKFQGNKL